MIVDPLHMMIVLKTGWMLSEWIPFIIRQMNKEGTNVI